VFNIPLNTVIGDDKSTLRNKSSKFYKISSFLNKIRLKILWLSVFCFCFCGHSVATNKCCQAQLSLHHASLQGAATGNI